jgi:hypothetical protein
MMRASVRGTAGGAAVGSPTMIGASTACLRVSTSVLPLEIVRRAPQRTAARGTKGSVRATKMRWRAT